MSLIFKGPHRILGLFWKFESIQTTEFLSKIFITYLPDLQLLLSPLTRYLRYVVSTFLFLLPSGSDGHASSCCHFMVHKKLLNYKLCRVLILNHDSSTWTLSFLPEECNKVLVEPSSDDGKNLKFSLCKILENFIRIVDDCHVIEMKSPTRLSLTRRAHVSVTVKASFLKIDNLICAHLHAALDFKEKGEEKAPKCFQCLEKFLVIFFNPITGSS